jgi:peptidoglycan/LPS O-acetylase OafA/YrhL
VEGLWPCTHSRCLWHQSAERSTNNFDLLRLIAAMMVVFSHAYVIVKEDANQVMIWFYGLH